VVCTNRTFVTPRGTSPSPVRLVHVASQVCRLDVGPHMSTTLRHGDDVVQRFGSIVRPRDGRINRIMADPTDPAVPLEDLDRVDRLVCDAVLPGSLAMVSIITLS